MKIVKKVIIGLLVLIVALGLIGLALPKGYKVERSTTIQAPAEVVFDQVNDLKKNEAWSPWKEEGMTLTYGPITKGKGASNSWNAKRMGSGSQTIEESVPNSAIRLHLDFGKQGTAKADWRFEPEGEATKVTQTMTGEQGNPYKRWMGLIMDKLIGKYFEQGLASLKQVSETRAAEIKAGQADAQPAAAAPAGDSTAATQDSTAASKDSTAPAAPAAR